MCSCLRGLYSVNVFFLAKLLGRWNIKHCIWPSKQSSQTKETCSKKKLFKSVFVLDWNGPHQLLKVVLHRVGINHHTNGYQCVKGKVEDLVAEEWNDPCSVLLYRKDGTMNKMNKLRMFLKFTFTLESHLCVYVPCKHHMLPCHI